ncbi:hypothetical protein [Actinokineospora pegani]|uniref:hypothetical protein n=1 Tax=Actinokineospora pegani TaxID=2654637 RepID=UPI0012E996AB|nr:hypothetical protein [Actinokineospora pegani]
MSHQVENTLAEMDAAMNKLKAAYEDIKIRREFFGVHHKVLTTAVARLTVEVADSQAGFEFG